MSFGPHMHGKQAAARVETVDLTLSSPSPEPEPEPEPRPQRHRQDQRHARPQQLPTYLNSEYGTTPARANGAPGSSLARAATNTTLSPSLVSTDHLRQIIKTSSPQRVADLLLELCKSSPALSGAVARGLAPHSTWAQDTIRDYKRRSGLPQVKSELLSSSVESPSRRPIIKRPSHRQHRFPHPPDHVKAEVDTLSLGSDDSLSDLEVLLTQPSRSSNFSDTPVAGPSSSSYRAPHNRTPASGNAPQSDGQSGLSVRIKPEPKTTGALCMQCHKTIQPGTICLFHLGRKRIATRGTQKIQTWSCCDEPLSTAGCCAGNHIPLRDSSLDYNLDNVVDDKNPPTGFKKPRLI